MHNLKKTSTYFESLLGVAIVWGSVVFTGFKPYCTSLFRKMGRKETEKQVILAEFPEVAERCRAADHKRYVFLLDTSSVFTQTISDHTSQGIASHSHCIWGFFGSHFVFFMCLLKGIALK